jgi:uncharacterized protein YbbC (DUF1343 family)
VALISHPAAVLPDLTSALEALRSAGSNIVTLFGMEHGFSGSAADGLAVGDGRHAQTGIPIYSLYGPQKEPAQMMLAGLDVLVYDVQDVGTRFYTFTSTLFYVLRAAGRYGLQVVVLDRPNPIGNRVEGPGIAPGFESFIGIVPMPIRHGLTLGEMAWFLNAENRLGADLEIVPMDGYEPQTWFDRWDRPWVPTSPGIPHLSTTLVYPGMCFLEGTNLSEGRGTGLPFEVVGAPWLDGEALASCLNQLHLPGVRFRPTHFEPSASKHTGENCQGVQVHVLDREVLRAVELGLHVVAACFAQSPQRCEFLPASWEGSIPHFDLLAGSDQSRKGILAGRPVSELVAGWDQENALFRAMTTPYRLYGAPE